MSDHHPHDSVGVGKLTVETTDGTSTGAYIIPQLCEYRPLCYTYNRNGYLAKKTHKTNGTVIDLAYDNLGNLIQFKNSKGSTVDYTVDGLDRRIVKKVSGAFVDGYLYQDSLRPATQLNSNGTVRAFFVYGTRINSPDILIKGGVTYRIVHDHLGSPIFVTDSATGDIAQAMKYDTWGNVLSDSNPGFQPFGFAGGIYDAEGSKKCKAHHRFRILIGTPVKLP